MTVGKHPADPTPSDTSPEIPPVIGPFPPIFMPFVGIPLRAIELILIEREVTKVHDLLEDQIAALKKMTFEEGATIPVASFGRGNESVTIASEHKRAQGVIVKSLEEMLVEMATFQDAILDAKKLIVGVDEQADADFRVFLARADDLDLGSDDPYADPTPTTSEEDL